MTTEADNWCFPADTIKFLTKLKANNNRDWFTEYKSAYDISVKRPATFFALMMTEKLSDLTGHAYTSKIFRVYRDIRFSKDKTPYNAHLHIGFIPEGRDAPGWYFGLEPDKLSVGAGTFNFEGAALDTYRERAARDSGSALMKTLSALNDKEGFRISDPELKRVPRQYDSEHSHANLLRRKGLTVWYDFPDTNAASTDGIAAACMEKFKKMKPVFDWLHQLPSSNAG